MSKSKPTQTGSILLILAGLFILCPNTLLLQGSVQSRYVDIAPIFAKSFLVVGIIMVIIGIIRLVIANTSTQNNVDENEDESA